MQLSNICSWNVLNNTMKSSIPDHRLDAPIWRFIAAQHFAYFWRQLRSLGVSKKRSMGSEGGALPIIGFSIETYLHYDAEVGGPLKRPLKDTFKRDVSTSLKPAPLENCERSQCSRRAHTFAEQHYGWLHHQPLQPPRCNGQVRSVLRSGVERASELCQLRLASRSTSDVGRKRYTQTAHTIRARTHWVAPWSFISSVVSPYPLGLEFSLITDPLWTLRCQ